jgi:hypothetical protein
VKPNTNSVEIHPQLSNNEHPVDGLLVGAGSLWQKYVYVPPSPTPNNLRGKQSKVTKEDKLPNVTNSDAFT